MTVLEFRTEVDASQKELYDFHLNFANAAIVTPSSIALRFLKIPEALEVGSEISVAMKQFGVWISWDIAIKELTPYSAMVDVQSGKGPFAFWKHEHLFVDRGKKSELIDRISYVLPFGFIGRWIDFLIVRMIQQRVFRYRHQKTKEYFTRK